LGNGNIFTSFFISHDIFDKIQTTGRYSMIPYKPFFREADFEE